jgi:hypothetical protein
MPNLNTLLDSNISLHCECIDRIYLNGYIPNLQRPGQAEYFLSVHRKYPVPSSALFGQMTLRFVDKIKQFAKDHHIPIVAFQRKQRKENVAQRYFQKAARRGRHGVVMIGVAQEKAQGFRSYKVRLSRGGTALRFSRQSVFVNHYYFYILDENFGPSFIKFCAYAPYTLRIWLNGHEWAKRQLTRQKIGYESLDNGFLAVDDPNRLQSTCDRLSADHIERYFRHWLAHLPHPFTAADHQAGYRYDLSILQLEISLTQVFHKPVQGREFFEEVIRENLDLGRPDRVQLVFARHIYRNTPSEFRTRIITEGVDPSIHIQYKKCRIKQYFKLGRALRTETTIDDAYDFDVGRSLRNFDYLRQLGRNINQRLLKIERTAQDCAVGKNLFESIVLPTQHQNQRVPGLRYGQPRVMALMQALTAFVFTPEGLTNQSLRPRVAALMNMPLSQYTTAKMSYDLRRLRLKGIVSRLDGKNRYALTSTGRKLALFFVKTYVRILKPGLQSMQTGSAPETVKLRTLAGTWKKLDQAIDGLVASAKLCA